MSEDQIAHKRHHSKSDYIGSTPPADAISEEDEPSQRFAESAFYTAAETEGGAEMFVGEVDNAKLSQRFEESAFYPVTEKAETAKGAISEAVESDGRPRTAVTSFVVDRLTDRLPIAFFCFSLAICVLAVPLPVVGGSGFGTLSSAPLIFLAFVGYYVGRPALAAFRHLNLDYEQFDELPPMTVSLPAYNESGTVRNTIDGIFSQDYPGPLEVVVCDDGSTDDTWDILNELKETYGDRLTIVQQENAGSAAARNTALAEGSHELVVSMDTDTVLKDNALYEAGASFKRNPDVVAVGTNVGVLNPNASIWTKMQVYNYLLAMEIARMFQSQLGFVLVLSGGCGVFKREVLEEIGGWNTTQLMADDTDLTVRIHEHGSVAYNPNIHAFTEVPETFRALWKQRLRWRQHGVTALMHHYRKQLNPRYGRFGVFGLPFRAAILLLILGQMGWFVVTFVTNRSSITGATLLLLFSVLIISIALAAISVGTATVVCRDRTALDHPSYALAYLFIYRFFHVSVRFLGTLLGLYSYYLLWRYEQEREIPLPI